MHSSDGIVFMRVELLGQHMHSLNGTPYKLQGILAATITRECELLSIFNLLRG